MEMKLLASLFSPVWVLITHEDDLIMQNNVSTTVKLSPSLYSVCSGEVTTGNGKVRYMSFLKGQG